MYLHRIVRWPDNWRKDFGFSTVVTPHKHGCSKKHTSTSNVHTIQWHLSLPVDFKTVDVSSSVNARFSFQILKPFGTMPDSLDRRRQVRMVKTLSAWYVNTLSETITFQVPCRLAKGISIQNRKNLLTSFLRNWIYFRYVDKFKISFRYLVEHSHPQGVWIRYESSFSQACSSLLQQFTIGCRHQSNVRARLLSEVM